MSTEPMLEVRIESQDPNLIAEIESTLAQVNAKRGEKTRDFVTVLAIAASAVKLINALLELKQRLEDKPDGSKVYVLNANRDQMVLPEATERKLSELIESADS
jgi:hypothetical protein